MDRKNLFKGNADFFFGIVVVIFGAIGCYLTKTTIKLASSRQMPMLLFGFIAVMGMGMSISSVVNRARGNEDQTKVAAKDLLVGILLPGVILIITWILIDFLGFYVAVFLLILALMVLQAKVSDGKVEFTSKKVIVTLAFAVAVTVVMYLIFHFIFALPTPKGIFGF